VTQTRQHIFDLVFCLKNQSAERTTVRPGPGLGRSRIWARAGRGAGAKLACEPGQLRGPSEPGRRITFRLERERADVADVNRAVPVRCGQRPEQPLEPVDRPWDPLRGGTSGQASEWLGPGSARWNDAESVKMVRPCWMADTRRVVNDRPSRTRSTV